MRSSIAGTLVDFIDQAPALPAAPDQLYSCASHAMTVAPLPVAASAPAPVAKVQATMEQLRSQPSDLDRYLWLRRLQRCAPASGSAAAVAAAAGVLVKLACLPAPPPGVTRRWHCVRMAHLCASAVITVA